MKKDYQKLSIEFKQFLQDLSEDQWNELDEKSNELIKKEKEKYITLLELFKVD